MIAGAFALSIPPALAAGETPCPPAQAVGWSVASERHIPPESFVQGFVIAEGRWWLSSGGFGRSYVEELNPTGESSTRKPIDRRLFAEGLALRNDELWLLSWQNGVGLRLNKDNLEVRQSFSYEGQGWGLAWSEERQQFLMSNGSGTLSWRDAENFALADTVTVRRGKRAVTHLNELELVGNMVYANVWLKDEILQIDTQTGCVRGVLGLHALWPTAKRPRQADVLNGIAYAPDTGWLWVTGKRWGRAFALALEN